VARLRRQVEQKVLADEQVPQRRAVADIDGFNPHLASDVDNIGEVRTALGDHAVDEQHLGAKADQPPRQRRADQADAAGNYRARPAEGGETRICAGSHRVPSIEMVCDSLARGATLC
jgi:hypothetical protein